VSDVVGLAAFDLDDTLLAGDSDALWGEFLSDHVYGEEHRRAHRSYQEMYRAGTLDIHAFLRFQLAPLAEHPLPHLHEWRRTYLEEKIRPILLPGARQLVADHRRRGHTLLIVTSTNRFLTEPIAELFGIPHLIAPEPEMRAGRYTGDISGTPSFGPGKVSRLKAWLRGRPESLEHCWFYSDSHNDLPLLDAVAHPVAVDPDTRLRTEAERRAWPIITLRP